jgi:hypothetical protein
LAEKPPPSIQRAFYLEAVPANGIAMRAARHERHIMSSRGHPAAEITSHGTRCHDRNPHLAPPRPKYSFRPKLARWKAARADRNGQDDDAGAPDVGKNQDLTDSTVPVTTTNHLTQQRPREKTACSQRGIFRYRRRRSGG